MGQCIYLPYIKIKDEIYSNNTDSLGYIKGDSEETTKRYLGMLKDEYGNADFSGNSFYGNQSYLNRRHRVTDISDIKRDDTKYSYCKIDCGIKSMGRKQFGSNDLIRFSESGDMCIILFEFDLSKIDSDAESELRFWVKDSMSINIHNEIEETERLRMLPCKNLKIEIDGVSGELIDCRILDFEAPFTVAVLVNKIRK